MSLGFDPPRGLEAYAAYNSVEYRTPREAVLADLEFMRGEQDREAVKVLWRPRSKLGGMNAERLVLSYKLKNDGSEWIYEAIRALRSVDNERTEAPSHEYAVTMTTTPASYAKDRAVFERVVASWRQTSADR